MRDNYSRWLGLIACLPVLGCADSSSPRPAARVAAVEALAPLTQTGAVGSPANILPAVRVTDQDGAVLAGTAVEFSVTTGSLVADNQTGSDGIARVRRWDLPASAGVAELVVRVGDLPELQFQATVVERGFNLEIRFLSGTPSVETRQAIDAAESVLESIIFADLPDEVVTSTPVCQVGGAPLATIDETIDDAIILLRIIPIDGLGGAGARGNPCLIRDPGTQTLVGMVDLDEAEWGVIGQELKRDFLLHEMIHALGFTAKLFNITTPSGFTRHCLELPSTGTPNPVVQDSHFSCAGARAGFDSVGGVSYTGLAVPLENGATTALTSSTLNQHWRKTTFDSELMTGWFNISGSAPLSLVTVRVLEDLGYGVTYAAAAPFALRPPIATLRGNQAEGVLGLVELPGPPIMILRSGGAGVQPKGSSSELGP